jgi:putative polyhydroxyalkanoate system protein
VADLHIVRMHTLGLAKARKIALDWAEQVERDFGMACTYEEGKTDDRVQFKRSGVHGTLHVTKDRFELDAKLGFLLGAFKDRIEAEIVKLLDGLLPHAAPATQAAAKPGSAKPAAKKAARK